MTQLVSIENELLSLLLELLWRAERAGEFTPAFFTFTIETLMPTRLTANSEQSLTEGLQFYYALLHAYIPNEAGGRPAEVEVSKANNARLLIHEMAREEAENAFQEAVAILL